MHRILPLAAALLSLASTAASAAEKASPAIVIDPKVVAGCDGPLDLNHPTQPCEDGGYITIEKKRGVPTAIRYSDSQPPPRTTSMLAAAPTTQLVKTPSGYMPAAPRPLAAGERFYCQPKANYQICGFNNNPANKYAWYDSAYYNLDGTAYGQGPSGSAGQSVPAYAAQGTVDQQLKVARQNAAHSGELEHEPTSEAVVRQTADGGMYAASYQKPQSILPLVAGIVAIQLATGVSNRIAYDSCGYYRCR